MKGRGKKKIVEWKPNKPDEQIADFGLRNEKQRTKEPKNQRTGM